jgi:hypothetical protein
MEMNDYALGRPPDPRYPTNLAILAFAMVVGAAGGALALLGGAGLVASASKGIVAGASVFFAWALSRELDPDHDWSAFVAAGLALGGLLLFDQPAFLPLLFFLIAMRLISRTTGVPAKLGDSLSILAVAVLASFQSHWLYGLLAALGFAADSRLPRPNRQHALYAGAAALAAIAAAWLGPAPLPDPDWSPVGLGAAGVLALVYLPHTLQLRSLAAVCDRYGQSLYAVRVRTSRGLALLGCALIAAWEGVAGVGVLMPLWAALLGTALFGYPASLTRRS